MRDRSPRVPSIGVFQCLEVGTSLWVPSLFEFSSNLLSKLTPIAFLLITYGHQVVRSFFIFEFKPVRQPVKIVS